MLHDTDIDGFIAMIQMLLNLDGTGCQVLHILEIN